MHAALLLAAILALGEVTSRASSIDAAAVRTALELRAPDAAAWDVAIEDGAKPGEVRARLQRGDESIERSFVLAASDTDGRSRELAAALALVIEQHEQREDPPAPDPDPDPTPPPTPEPSTQPPPAEPQSKQPVQGWLAIGARVGAGSPADPDGGVTLRGGLFWGRRHVQPIASFGTVHARRGNLKLDGLRTGVGVAGGVPLGPWWIGGSVIPQLSWLRARDRVPDDDVGLTTEIAALGQWRGRGLLVGLRLGVDVNTPPVRARGTQQHLRLGPVRFVLGIEVGFTLAPR